MKLLYSLLFIFLINSSLYSTIIKVGNDYVNIDLENFIYNNNISSCYTIFNQYFYTSATSIRYCSGSDVKTYNNVTSSSGCNDGDILVNYICTNVPTYPNLTSSDKSSDYHSYNYDDGSYQGCSTTTGACTSYDKDGNQIPNIPIDDDNDPLTPPITYPTVSDLATERMLTIAGLTLAGLATGTAIVGGTLAGVSGATLLTASQQASLYSLSVHAGLYNGYNLYNQDNLYTENSPTSDNSTSTADKGIKIDLDKWDFSTQSSDASNSVDADSNPVTTATNSNNEQVRVTTKSDTIEVEKTSIDGTKTTTTLPKNVLTAPTVSNDFSEQNNLDTFDYVTTVDLPEVIHNDGTYTKGVTTTTQNTYNPSNSSSSVTSTSSTTPTQSTTSVTAPSTSTTSTTNSDSSTSTSTQDMSAITNRLNQIISQNSKSNSTLSNFSSNTKSQLDSLINNSSTLNNLSTSIKTNTKDTADELKKQSLDLKGILNNTDILVENSQKMIDGEEDSSNIANMISNYAGEYSEFRGNLMGEYDTLKSNVDGIQSSLDDGFEINFPTGSVSTCAYSANVNFGFASLPVDIDICKVISPLYSVLYFVFYVLFFGTFLNMSLNMLLNSRSN